MGGWYNAAVGLILRDVAKTSLKSVISFILLVAILCEEGIQYPPAVEPQCL